MGQGKIGNVLTSNYPRYLGYQEIMQLTGESKGSVMAALRKLKKRDEVQIKTAWGNKPKAGWVNKYRIKSGG